jgi:hypothetical protein
MFLQKTDRDDRLDVIDFTGRVVTVVGQTIWGNWKIVGEDTYAKKPQALLVRLLLREQQHQNRREKSK